MDEQNIIIVGMLGSMISAEVIAAYHLIKFHRDNSEGHFYRMDILPDKENVPHAIVPFKLDKRGLKKDVSKTINDFIAIMKKERFDLSNLYESFSPDMIEIKKSTETGTFDTLKKKLLIDPTDVRSTLIRALLDMCIMRDYPRFTASGFERIVYVGNSRKPSEKLQRFGYGLNEGYKDVILERYFNIPPRCEELTDLARLIELAVGKDEMENSFMNSDIQKFDRSLSSKYNKSVDSTYWEMGEQVIFNMDKLYDSFYHGGLMGIKLSSKRFSTILTTLTFLIFSLMKDKEETARKERISRCANPSYFIDSLGRCNELDNEMEEVYNVMKHTMSTTREIINKYRIAKSIRPAITQSDFIILREEGKKYLMQPIL